MPVRHLHATPRICVFDSELAIHIYSKMYCSHYHANGFLDSRGNYSGNSPSIRNAITPAALLDSSFALIDSSERPVIDHFCN